MNVGSQDVRVLDAKGKRVDKGNTRHGSSNRVVEVDVDSGLADGTYVVDWRAISADSHPVHGGFQFSIGKPSTVDQAAVDAAAGADDDRVWQIVAGVVRFVAYVGALLAAGGVLFRWWRKDPSTRAGGLVVAVGAGVALVALAVQVPIQAALSTGEGLTSITDEGVLTRVLSEGFGLAAAVSAVAPGGAARPRRASPTGSRCARSGFVAALVAVAGFAVTGHTRSMTPRWLAYLADGAPPRSPPRSGSAASSSWPSSSGAPGGGHGRRRGRSPSPTSRRSPRGPWWVWWAAVWRSAGWRSGRSTR